MQYIKIANTLKLSNQEWLDIRKMGIGGSDAGAVLGFSPYKSSFSVYADKLGFAEEKTENEAMKQGKELEDYVAKRFIQETGKKVRKINSVLQSKENPFMLANVDRWIVGENAGLECKTSRDILLKRYKNGEYPEEYYCQCLHYMAVTGANKWYLAVLIFGTDFKIFEILRDEEEINSLIESEKAFWECHILPKVPPPPDGKDSTTNAIKKMYSECESNTVITSTDNEKIEQYIKLKEQQKELESKIKEAENIIKLEMQSAEKLATENHIVSWKTQQTKKLNIDKLKNDYQNTIDFSKYYQTKLSRVFRVIKFKEA